MPTSRRQPVVIEVKSDHSSHKMAPSSPPKVVRFMDQKEAVTGITRPLTPSEAWSLYYFEIHARSCLTCHRPYDIVMAGGTLCEAGHDLASDVQMHCYHRDGQIYSTKREGSHDIRVEVPHSYERLVGLLKGIDRRGRRARLAPIISYHQPKQSHRAPAVQPIYEEEEPYSPYVVPARSRSERRSRQKVYSTIIVGNDDDRYERSRLSSKNDKRGSLYKENAHPRQHKEYRIEIVEPEDRHRRRRKDKTYYD